MPPNHLRHAVLPRRIKRLIPRHHAPILLHKVHPTPHPPVTALLHQTPRLHRPLSLGLVLDPAEPSACRGEQDPLPGLRGAVPEQRHHRLHHPGQEEIQRGPAVAEVHRRPRHEARVQVDQDHLLVPGLLGHFFEVERLHARGVPCGDEDAEVGAVVGRELPVRGEDFAFPAGTEDGDDPRGRGGSEEGEQGLQEEQARVVPDSLAALELFSGEVRACEGDEARGHDEDVDLGNAGGLGDLFGGGARVGCESEVGGDYGMVGPGGVEGLEVGDDAVEFGLGAADDVDCGGGGVLCEGVEGRETDACGGA